MRSAIVLAFALLATACHREAAPDERGSERNKTIVLPLIQ